MWQVELQQKKERSGSGKMSDAQSNFLSFRSSLLISPARRSAKVSNGRSRYKIGGYHFIQFRKNKPANYCFLRRNMK